MTLVECYDRSVTQNIVSCLHLRPEKLIFLGGAEEVKAELDRYREFLTSRGMNTVVQQRPVKMSRIESIAAVLREVVKQEDRWISTRFRCAGSRSANTRPTAIKSRSSPVKA